MWLIDVARAYRQLPLDPGDWPLICFQFEGRYYIDISLSVGLTWVASHCQEVTNMVSPELRREGLSLLNYIDDFGEIARSRPAADLHFSQLHNLLTHVGLQETCHKSSPPSQTMVWSGFQFNTINMIVTLPPESFRWWCPFSRCGYRKASSKGWGLCWEKVIYVAQCCAAAQLFTNRMLETTGACPLQGVSHLSTDFQKDLAWFQRLLPCTDGVHMFRFLWVITSGWSFKWLSDKPI